MVDSDNSLAMPNQGDVLKASNDYYFNASAEDDGDGSIDNPFKFLTADRIKSNCNIYLANGEYQLNSPKSIEKVNICGNDVEKTIIQYNGVGFTVSSSLTIQNVTFLDMSITNYGDITANNTVFSYGSGSRPDRYGNNFGGAIYSHEDYSNAHVTLNNCTFEHNFAVYGGAIYMGNGYLEIIDTIFNSNMAYNYGGAIACEKARNVVVSKSKFYNSISINDAGGAVYLRVSPFTGKSIEFINSSSTFGSAITSLNSDVSIANANFENNSAKWDGGAIYHMYGDFSITGSKFTNNSARNGGALFIDNSTSLYLRSNIFTNNVASYAAGAIYSLLNKLKTPIEPYNIFKDNQAYYMDDIFDTSKLNLTIGNGNYSMYRANLTEIDVLPSRYNLFEEGYTTPVKDQETGGNCWAFAAIAAVESCILKANGTSIDLSEENMKNLMALYSDYGWHYDVNDGGNDYLVWGYLTSWLGPILENDDLHDDKSAISPIINSILHIQNILFLKRDNYTDNDAIKKALMQYGAVSTSIAFYNNYISGNNYYCYNTMDCNHAVAIVGWDDNYSKSNFKWSSSIEGDGAWIVKNSWGPNWGNNGYFYVSYYDKNFARPGVNDASFTIIFNDTIKYDKNYQYDIPGMSDYFLNSSSSVWYKNIFEATDDEYLAAVSTFFEKDTNWTAYIYVNDELKLVKEGKSHPGYYTIDLNRLIPLKIGDIFEVVFNITVDGEAAFPISERSVFNKLMYGPGISYMSYDGENWQDLFELSWTYSSHYYISQVACIKAFTVLDEIRTSLNLTVDFNNENPANITAKILDKYGNPLKSGEVTFNINEEYYAVDVADGIAVLHYAFSDVFNNIYAHFESDGYISSQDYTAFFIEKYKLDIDFNITQNLNNVIIDMMAKDKISNEAKLSVNEKEYLIIFEDGKYSLNLTDLENGVYNLTLNITFPFESIYENNIVTGVFVIDMKNSKILAENLIITDDDDMNYKVFLFDENDNPLLNKTLEVILDGEIYNLTTDSNGQAVLPLNLNYGAYDVKVNFKGDNNYFNSNATSNIVLKNPVLIDLEIDKVRNNVTLNINISKQINDTLTVVINNKTEIIEVKNGTASLNLINLENDVYDISIKINRDYYIYDEITTSFVVDVRRTQIISDDAVISDEGQNYTVILLDEFNNALSNKSVELILDGVTYNAYTDINGHAVFPVMLEVGDYVSVINFKGDNDYLNSSSSANFKVKTKIDINLTAESTQNNVLVTLKLSKKITGYLTLIINNDTATVKVINGIARHRLYDLENGIYNLSVSLDKDIYLHDDVFSVVVIDVIHTQILAEHLITDDESPLNYTVYLIDTEGNPVLNKSVEINLNETYYNQKTDDNGQIIIPLNLKSGIYDLNIAFKGDDKYIGSYNSTTIKVKTKVNLHQEIDKFANNVTLTFNLSKSVNVTLAVGVNNDSYDVEVIDGIGYLTLSDLDNDVYDVNVNLNDDNYEFDVAESQFTIDMKQTNILCGDIVVNDEDYFIYNITLIDENNQPIADKEAEIILNGTVINRTTDKNGQIIIPINLTQGIYTLIINIAGDDYYFENTKSSVITVKSKVVIDLSIDKFANNVTLVFNLSKSVNDNLTVGVNNDSYVVGVVDGVGRLSLFNLDNGVYDVNVGINEDIYDYNTIINQFIVEVRKTEIIMDELFINDDDLVNYTISLTDEEGNALLNKSLALSIGGQYYNLTTDLNGQIIIPIKLKPGEYEVKAEFRGDDSYFKTSNVSSFNVKCNVSIDLIIKKYENNVNMTVELSKSINDTLTLIINNKSYEIVVNEGHADLSLSNLDNSIYDVSISLDDNVYDFNQIESQFTIDFKQSRIIANDLTVFENEFAVFNITLIDENSNPITNRSVEFNLNGTDYVKTTDMNGKASVLFYLSGGIYNIISQFGGEDNYSKSIIINKIMVETLKNITASPDNFISDNIIKLNSLFPNETFLVTINDKIYSVNINNYTEALPLNNISNGVYNVTISLNNNDDPYFKGIASQFVIDIKDSKIISADLIAYHNCKTTYSVSLTDLNGNALVGKMVLFDLNGVKTSVLTDKYGQAIVEFKLPIGTYYINISYLGDDYQYYSSSTSNLIIVKSAIEGSDSTTKTYNSKYTIRLFDNAGNPLKNSKITYTLDDVIYVKSTDTQGYLSVDILQNPGNHTLTFTNPINNETLAKNILVMPRIAQNKNLVMYEYAGKYFKVLVLDDNGNHVKSREIVQMFLNGKKYNVKTNANGYASLKVNLKNKIYTITTKYKGYSVSNKIKVKPVLITKNVAVKYGKKITFKAKLLNKNGKIIKNKKVTFKFKGKKYIVKTNKRGYATLTLKLKLKAGNYKIYTSYGKSKATNKITVKK